MSDLDLSSMRIALSGAAWIAIGAIQLQMDGGDKVSILWQLLPYALLTLGEVLVSATGLEFAYSQAPSSMKGVIMALWYLAVTIGNLWVIIVNASGARFVEGDPIVMTAEDVAQEAFIRLLQRPELTEEELARASRTPLSSAPRQSRSTISY